MENDPKNMSVEQLNEIVRHPTNSHAENSLYNRAKAELDFRKREQIAQVQSDNLIFQEKLIKRFSDLIQTQLGIIDTLDHGLDSIAKSLTKKRNIWLAILIFVLVIIVIPIIIGTCINILTDIIHKSYPWLINQKLK